MANTITPEQLLGEFIGTLMGICAWDIPQGLKDKLERHIKRLEQIDVSTPKINELIEDFNNNMRRPVRLSFPIYNRDGGVDIFDTTEMD